MDLGSSRSRAMSGSGAEMSGRLNRTPGGPVPTPSAPRMDHTGSFAADHSFVTPATATATGWRPARPIRPKAPRRTPVSGSSASCLYPAFDALLAARQHPGSEGNRVSAHPRLTSVPDWARPEDNAADIAAPRQVSELPRLHLIPDFRAARADAPPSAPKPALETRPKGRLHRRFRHE